MLDCCLSHAVRDPCLVPQQILCLHYLSYRWHYLLWRVSARVVNPSHSGLPFLLCVHMEPSRAGVHGCCWAGSSMGKAHSISAPECPATSSLLLYGGKKGSAGVTRQHYRALHSALSSDPRQEHRGCHTSCQKLCLRFAEGHAPWWEAAAHLCVLLRPCSENLQQSVLHPFTPCFPPFSFLSPLPTVVLKFHIPFLTIISIFQPWALLPFSPPLPLFQCPITK